MSSDQQQQEDFQLEGMYSEEQLWVLFFISYVPALLSLGGSSWIIRSIYRQRTHALHMATYQRLMIGLSVSDWIASFSLIVFKNWTLPEETNGILTQGAKGTLATCSFTAFFYNANVASALYTASLSLYFVLHIKCRVTARNMQRCIEPWLHVLSVGIMLAIGVLGLIGQAFGPSPVISGICWLHEYPNGCDDDTSLVECQRSGAEFPVAFLVFSFTIIITTISMMVLLIHVWTTERTRRQYAGGGSIHMEPSAALSLQRNLHNDSSTFSLVSPATAVEGAPDPASRPPRRHSSFRPTRQLTSSQEVELAPPPVSEQQRATLNSLRQSSSLVMTRETASQAIHYIGFFLLSFAPVMCLPFIEAERTRENAHLFFPLAVVAGIFMPLQGFFNCIIYTRPQWKDRKLQRRASVNHRSSSSNPHQHGRRWSSSQERKLQEESSPSSTTSTTDPKKDGQPSSIALPEESEEHNIVTEPHDSLLDEPAGSHPNNKHTPPLPGPMAGDSDPIYDT